MSVPPKDQTVARDSLVARTGIRLRLVGTTLLLGVAVVTTVLFASSLTGGFVTVETAFALGSLVFGFSLLGWSSAVALGRSIEALQDHLDTRTEWTAPDARRAMTRILGFGLGIMFGTVLFGSLF